MNSVPSPKASKNLLVLDWNGTLLDDTPVCWRGFNDLMKAMWQNPVTFDQYQTYYDMPITRLFSNAGISHYHFDYMIEKIPESYLPTYFKLSKNAPLRQGALDLVKHAHKENCHVIILSNHFSDDIKEKAIHRGLWPHIDEILAFKSGEQFKNITKGEKLKAYMDKNGFAPHRTVIIGDTQEEIRIALEANIPCLCLSGGSVKADRLIAEDRTGVKQPHFLVPELTMAPTILNEIGLFSGPVQHTQPHRSVLLTPLVAKRGFYCG